MTEVYCLSVLEAANPRARHELGCFLPSAVRETLVHASDLLLVVCSLVFFGLWMPSSPPLSSFPCDLLPVRVPVSNCRHFRRTPVTLD